MLLKACGKFYLPPPLRLEPEQASFTGLKWLTSTLPENIIHVRRSVWEGHKQSTKSRNANRAIHVQPNLVAMLKDYLNGRPEGLVFPAKNGKTAPQ
jgi:hypothetical protein